MVVVVVEEDDNDDNVVVVLHDYRGVIVHAQLPCCAVNDVLLLFFYDNDANVIAGGVFDDHLDFVFRCYSNNPAL